MREKKIKNQEIKKNSTINILSSFYKNQHLYDNLLNLYSKNKLPQAVMVSGSDGMGQFDFLINLTIDMLQIRDKKKEFIERELENNLLTISSDNEIITLDQIHNIKDFFILESEKPRVIIIDSVDFMNKNSINAILKTLEELPENCFIFIIWNKKTNLLETVKSRVVEFNFKDVSFDAFVNILEINENCKNLKTEELKKLYHVFKSPKLSLLGIKNDAHKLILLFEDLIVKNNYTLIDFELRNWLNLKKKTSSIFELKSIIESIFSYFTIEICKKDIEVKHKNELIKEFNSLILDLKNPNIHLLFFFNIIKRICNLFNLQKI